MAMIEEKLPTLELKLGLQNLNPNTIIYIRYLISVVCFSQDIIHKNKRKDCDLREVKM